jgi:hypothetical protein
VRKPPAQAETEAYDQGKADGRKQALRELVPVLMDVGRYRTWLSNHDPAAWLRVKPCSAVLVAHYIEETMMDKESVR